MAHATAAPIIDGDTARIPLSRGLHAVVDVADLALVVGWSWQAERSGRTMYATRRMDSTRRNERIRMHRVILGFGPGAPEVDHIDGDGLNNRRSNLREATTAQNNRNQQSRAGSTSAYKGVSWCSSRDCWQVAIKAEGKARFIGRFHDEMAAALAYDAAAIEAHGEFARLNFPSVIS